MAQVQFNGEWKTGTSGSETSLTDFSSKVKSIKLTRNGETLDVTNLGSTTHKYAKGLVDAEITVDFYYDSTIWLQQHNLLGDTTAISFSYGPEGTTTGMPKISGTSMLFVSKVDESVDVGQVKMLNVTYKVSGAPTFGTY